MGTHTPNDAAQVWADAQEHLRRRLPPEVLSTWLGDVRPASVSGSTLYVQAPKRTQEWVRRRFGRQISQAVTSAVPEVTAIEWIDSDGQSTAATPPPTETRAQLSLDKTFDQFVIGTPNRFAHAAALAVAELPGHAYNPLFLHGSPGIGKTHLAQAIGNYINTHDGSMTVLYATVDSFTTEFTGALRRNRIDAFKATYRNPDVLIVDDVQLLEDRPRTVEEFFHTFDELHGRGAQIILTADRVPAQITKLHDRLRDRFEAGLVVELDPPDFDMRLAILKKRIGSDDPPVESEALELLARVVAPNIRTLEGALIRARAFASLTEQKLTTDVASHVVSSIGTKDIREGFPTPTVEQIQEAVRKRDGRRDRRPDVEKTQPSGRLCSPDRHVSDPRAHPPVVPSDRAQFRWQGPHDGHARAQENHRRAPHRTRHSLPCGFPDPPVGDEVRSMSAEHRDPQTRSQVSPPASTATIGFKPGNEMVHPRTSSSITPPLSLTRS